jgi:hypothetical protein
MDGSHDFITFVCSQMVVVVTIVGGGGCWTIALDVMHGPHIVSASIYYCPTIFGWDKNGELPNNMH